MFNNLFLESVKQKNTNYKNEGFAYTLFYFSCMLTTIMFGYGIIAKENNVFVVQKLFIHTMVDLINTLFEANFKDKNYFYELIVNRFKQRLKSIYNDENLLKQKKRKFE